MKELTDADPCPVKGQNEGVPMGQVPSSFLDWLDGQSWCATKYPAVKAYIAKNRKSINQDLERRDRR